LPSSAKISHTLSLFFSLLFFNNFTAVSTACGKGGQRDRAENYFPCSLKKGALSIGSHGDDGEEDGASSLAEYQNHHLVLTATAIAQTKRKGGQLRVTFTTCDSSGDKI